MKAVQVVAFGRAQDVVKLNEVPDVGSPGPNEVVVAVEAAPINNSDFMIIAGRYGYLPTPPATLGIEGVGRVVAAGSQVKNLKVGDRTLIPFTVPTWTFCEHVNTGDRPAFLFSFSDAPVMKALSLYREENRS